MFLLYYYSCKRNYIYGGINLSVFSTRDHAAKRAMMLSEPLLKVIPLLAIPSVISLIITSLYNMLDTFFVSQLGTAAIGAVGICLAMDQFISMFGAAIGNGAASFISRLLGADQKDQAEQVLATSLFLTVLICAILCVVGHIFLVPILKLVGAIDSILPYAVTYANYTLYSAPFMVAAFVLNQSLRAEGSPIYSMFGILSGAVLNCVLAPLFIFVFHWGIAGAGIASSISKAFSFIILLIPYLRRSSTLKLSIKNIRFTHSVLDEVGKMSIPIFCRNGLMVFVTIVTSRTATSFGEAAIAAISICNRAMNLFASVLMGFGQGYQPVVGYNWGAGKYERVSKAFWFAVKFGIVCMAVVGLPMILFAEQFMRIFSATDPEVIRIGSFAIRLQAIALPIGAIVVVINMTYTALGRALGATVLGLARQGICFLPSVLILPAAFGVMGLAAAQATADFLSIAIGIPLGLRILKEIKAKMKSVLPES